MGNRVRFGGDPHVAAGYARHVSWTNRLLTHDEISLARVVESPLAHPSVTFRRELVERWGGYREGDFPEDYELWLRWLEAGVRMDKLAESLLVWNDSPTRLSRCDRRYDKEAFYRLKARYPGRWLAAHNPHHPAVVRSASGTSRSLRRRCDGAWDEPAEGTDAGSILQRLQRRPDPIGRRDAGRLPYGFASVRSLAHSLAIWRSGSCSLGIVAQPCFMT